MTQILTISDFQTLLLNNNGLIIIKFSADWCRPCKLIEQQVHYYFSRLPNYIQPIIVDIDASFDLYALLKRKKMVHGIPAILMYKRYNTSFIPDEIVNSSNREEIDIFFQKCLATRI